MSVSRRTTDSGTAIIHVALVCSFLIAVGTGLRIATDNPATEWLIALDPVLPTADPWYRHLWSGLALACALSAYVIYVRRARLHARTRLDSARILMLLQPGAQRWGALNTLIFKILLWSLVVEVITGCILFVAPHRSVLVLHLTLTFVTIAAVISHVALHAAHGGLAQLLRVVRPARLEIAPPPPDLAELLAEQLAKQTQPRRETIAFSAPKFSTTAQHAQTETGAQRTDAQARHLVVESPRVVKLSVHPLATALAAATVVATLGLTAEYGSRQTLHIREIDARVRPTLDGDLSDPAWVGASPVSVLTTHGGDFGGTYQSQVEIRAVHDGTYVYFSFVWEDPTRSLRHQPLVKRAGRWHVAAGSERLADEKLFNEDKFSVLLTRPGTPLIGDAIHLARKPLADRPPSATKRGLHFTPDGSIADVWLWRSSHGGVVGHVDNCHFGAPAQVSEATGGSTKSYAGGFAIDPGPPAYQWNVSFSTEAADAASVLPIRLPRDLAQIVQALGRISNNPSESDSEGSRWWMTEAETVPYTPERDAKVPDGTIIPSIVVPDRLEMTSTSIRGAARWAAGRWSLEMTRRLYTGSSHDIPITTGTMLWVAAFDHAEKRHTRHLRPFILEVH